MDPTETLRRQRRLLARLKDERAEDGQFFFNDVRDLVELCIALDEWISKGGFLPDAWSTRGSE